MRPVNAVTEILQTFAFELAGVPRLQQLAVDGDLAERFLQIVAGGVRKLFQVGISPALAAI